MSRVATEQRFEQDDSLDEMGHIDESFDEAQQQGEVERHRGNFRGFGWTAIRYLTGRLSAMRNLTAREAESPSRKALVPGGASGHAGPGHTVQCLSS